MAHLTQKKRRPSKQHVRGRGKRNDDVLAKMVGCGCDRAGIGLFGPRHEVQRCDNCQLFETDDDAAAAVDELLKLLHREYAQFGGTVADAFERLEELQQRQALRLVEPALAEGFDNCGGDETDNIFAEPLAAVRRALGTHSEKQDVNGVLNRVKTWLANSGSSGFENQYGDWLDRADLETVCDALEKKPK